MFPSAYWQEIISSLTTATGLVLLFHHEILTCSLWLALGHNFHTLYP